MAFANWLLSQVDRNDSIGDLACDFRDDPERGRTETPRGLRRRLNEAGACEGAHEALTRAAREFDQAGDAKSNITERR
jgi:hypothetical protein